MKSEDRKGIELVPGVTVCKARVLGNNHEIGFILIVKVNDLNRLNEGRVLREICLFITFLIEILDFGTGEGGGLVVESDNSYHAVLSEVNYIEDVSLNSKTLINELPNDSECLLARINVTVVDHIKELLNAVGEQPRGGGLGDSRR